jgi:methionyl-tRNA synthetase
MQRIFESETCFGFPCLDDSVDYVSTTTTWHNTDSCICFYRVFNRIVNFLSRSNKYICRQKKYRLREERRLFASELRALDRESQTQHVLQRKNFLAKTVPKMEEEMIGLQKSLRKLLDSPTDQLNPAGKYYVLAEKLVKV